MAGTGGVPHVNAAGWANVIGMLPVAVPVWLVIVTVETPGVVDDCRVNWIFPFTSIVRGDPPTMVPLDAPTFTWSPGAT